MTLLYVRKLIPVYTDDMVNPSLSDIRCNITLSPKNSAVLSETGTKMNIYIFLLYIHPGFCNILFLLSQIANRPLTILITFVLWNDFC